MRSTSRKRRSNLRLAFAGPFPLYTRVARKVDGGEQQIAHLFFKLCFIHHGLLRFVHHFVDFFMDFVQYRAKRVPVKPYCRAAFLDLMGTHQGGQTQRDVIQRGVLGFFSPFGAFNLLPARQHFRAVARRGIAKDMRMAALACR